MSLSIFLPHIDRFAKFFHCQTCARGRQFATKLGMSNSFSFQIRISTAKIWIKLELCLYICGESLSNLRLMSALWGEMKATARMPHAGKQYINSAISQDVKPCLLRCCYCLDLNIKGLKNEYEFELEIRSLQIPTLLKNSKQSIV